MPFMRQNRRSFVLGVLSSMGVVGVRIGLPWIFKLLLKPVIKGDKVLNLPFTEQINPMIISGLLIFIMLLAWGFFDQRLRWYFAKFSIGVTRLAQLKAAESLEVAAHYSRVKGDLASRLLGDAARFRSGLKSFLVLVLVNSMLLLVACTVLLLVDFEVGLVMSTAAGGIFLVTLWSAMILYRKASRKRKKEGRFVERLNQRSLGEPIDDFDFQPHEDHESEALSTKIQGRATWIAYSLFGISTVIALMISVSHLQAKQLHQSDLVVLMLYIFNIRAPIIRLTRQGCKGGQTLACARRLQKLFADVATTEIMPLQERIGIHQLKIRSREGSERKYAMKLANLVIPAGTSIALIGTSGAGKSLLLKALSGQAQAKRALVSWDEASYDEDDLLALSNSTYYLPQNPSWSRQPLSHVIGVKEIPEDKQVKAALAACGFKKLLKGFPEGLATQVSSGELSFSQRRSVALAQAVLTEEAIVLLDTPELGLKRSAIPRFLRAVSNVHSQRTLMVALSDESYADLFDRVVRLNKGKVRFDGSPLEWEEKKRAVKAAKTAKTQ
jgi:ABC-type multidrug transport system fused ATPase/permease subunit